MAQWEMTCSCGDAMQYEGNTAEEAADGLLNNMMTPSAVAAHMAAKHPGEPVPSQDQVRQGLVASARQVAA